MSSVVCDRGYYYLRENNKNIKSFGKKPPVLYKPQIMEGDAQVKVFEIQKETVALVVTSPPYFQIKDYSDYGVKKQIGYLQGYDEYINSLKEVWRGCSHVLFKGGRLCINIGDQFTRTTDVGKHVTIPNHSSIIQSCINLGFDYLGSIIWEKMSTTHTSGGASVMGSYPFPRNGMVEYNYEHILIFRKPGESPKVDKKTKETSKLTKQEWFTFFNSPWKFTGIKQANHIAQFPEELPRRLIRMFSFIGETVLDPFVGSGTTCIAAVKNRRKSIGIELNSDYVSLAKGNIQSVVDGTGKHWRWEHST